MSTSSESLGSLGLLRSPWSLVAFDALPFFLTYLVTLFVLTSLSLTVIMQEIKFNDMSPVTQKTLRILMNKFILYAGMTLTAGFGIERAVLGLGQVGLFLLVYVSQFLTNRRIENQMENGYGTSWQSVFKYVAVSCVTGLTGGMVAIHVLGTVVTDAEGGMGGIDRAGLGRMPAVRAAMGTTTSRVGVWGLHAHTFVCALDACMLMVLSFQGLLMYFVRMLAVVCTMSVRVKGGRRVIVKRKPTAEVAFYTEVQGLLDAMLELGMHGASCMEYAVVYAFRDGVFVHVFDLAILLDLRYMIAHSKKRMARYHILHRRAQFVMGMLAREVQHVDAGGTLCAPSCSLFHHHASGSTQESSCQANLSSENDHARRTLSTWSECAICMESIVVGRRLRCGHVFHLKCLLGWIKECDGGKCTCPLCRSDLMGAVSDIDISGREAATAVFTSTNAGFLTDDDVDLNDGRFFQ